ncbi:MAG: winged helix-turn-helix domain-containing protein, partial [Acidobacteria bacterium]|nr:winged helix-turn-helix domain-containing protein [Acidobacteriota bacterium]
EALTESGYRAIVTGEHRELGQIIRAARPPLVLLGLVLLGADGSERMRSVPELSDLPVIFISGYGRDETIARALESGAADYLVKPFSPTELTARIRAALRRAEHPEPFALGALSIDFDRRRVNLEGRELELTATEYEVLCALSLNAGRVITYEALLHSVWKDRGHANVKLVRAFVNRLRRRLGDDAKNPAYIVTVRGVGYRMKRNAGR